MNDLNIFKATRFQDFNFSVALKCMLAIMGKESSFLD